MDALINDDLSEGNSFSLFIRNFQQFLSLLFVFLLSTLNCSYSVCLSASFWYRKKFFIHPLYICRTFSTIFLSTPRGSCLCYAFAIPHHFRFKRDLKLVQFHFHLVAFSMTIFLQLTSASMKRINESESEWISCHLKHLSKFCLYSSSSYFRPRHSLASSQLSPMLLVVAPNSY